MSLANLCLKQAMVCAAHSSQAPCKGEMLWSDRLRILSFTGSLHVACDAHATVMCGSKARTQAHANEHARTHTNPLRSSASTCSTGKPRLHLKHTERLSPCYLQLLVYQGVMVAIRRLIRFIQCNPMHSVSQKRCLSCSIVYI